MNKLKLDALIIKQQMNIFQAGVMAGQDLVHEQAVNMGWWHDLETGEPIERNVGELLMLVVSEVAEAMEGQRKNLDDDHLPERKMFEVELADTVIRILDIAGRFNMDLAGAIVEKLAYNRARKDHQLSERKKPHGKKW